MTDLVQKIADAVNAAWDAWSDDTNDERPFIVVQRDAIRQSLADAGGAVAYRDEAGTLYPCAESVRNYMPKGRMATPLYTHPDSGRVAELEAQLAIHANGFAYRVQRDRIAALEQQLTSLDASYRGAEMLLDAAKKLLTESREREGRMRQALEKIAAIEDELHGGDWDEIERARGIASTALAADKEKNDE